MPAVLPTTLGLPLEAHLNEVLRLQRLRRESQEADRAVGLLPHEAAALQQRPVQRHQRIDPRTLLRQSFCGGRLHEPQLRICRRLHMLHGTTRCTSRCTDDTSRPGGAAMSEAAALRLRKAHT